MIGGKILSFETDLRVVTFKVKENESESICYVKAEMDFFSQTLIDEGSDIWWTSDVVYVTFDEVPDCKFRKVGNSYTDGV